MAQYKIQDPKTGKAVTIEGDHAPTQAEAEQIFGEAGLRPKAPILNGIGQLAGGVLGQTVGGDLGALGGAAAGALVPGGGETGATEAVGAAGGGYAGGVAGAGIGSGIGNAGADLIRKYLLGDSTVNSAQTINNSLDAAKIGAAATAIGGPIMKGIGIAAHPVEAAMEGIAPATEHIPFLQGVNQILNNSTKSINMSDVSGLLSDFEKNILPNVGNKLKSDEISAAYDTLKNSITKNYGKEVEGTTGFPQIGKVPIKAAQEIKQNLYNLAREYYGFQGPAEAQVQKALGNTMKNAISKAEPGVNLPNFGAQAGYVLPDIAKGLSTVVGFGQPAAAKVINSGINLVPGLVGKAFPLQNGAISQQVLPRLLQLIGMGNASSQSQQ